MLKDKNGRIDARNLLSAWSFIKWIIDIGIVVGGGGIMAHMPNLAVLSLLFVLWLWSLIKLVADTPLVILWLIGRIQWTIDHRKKKKRRKKRKWAMLK